MPETSIKDQIKKLVEIQKTDGEIYRLNQDLKEKPLLVDRLKNEYEAKKATLNELEEQLKTILLHRKEQELVLKEKEELIAKSNTQLSEIKTNKEYTAKLTEIESIKADMSIVEDSILVSFEEGEKINEQIGQEKGILTQEEKKYLDKKKEVDDEAVIIKDRIKVLEGQRRQLAPDIDQTQLVNYERILKHKEGQAIVPIKDNACGGCFMGVTAQMINAIKMSDQLVSCEMCNRILYLEDHLE